MSQSVMPRFFLTSLRIFLAWAIALGFALGLAVSAQGQGLGAEGVVIASFSQRDNAERHVRSLARDMAASDAVLTVLPDGSGLFRVVAQSPQLASRRLLQRLRISGFPDAWHITDNALLGSARIASAPVAVAAAIRDKTQPKAETSGPISEVRPAAPVESAPADVAGRGEQTVFGSEAGVDLHQLSIQTLDHAGASITIDGRIDEAVWQGIPYYDNMGVSIPDLGTDAEFATKIRLFATEKGLYISADMEQPADTLVERLTRRDDWVDRDLFGVTIDASGEGKLGYWFYVALGNSLNDGKVLPERRFQRDWDGHWTAKAARTESGWSAEMYLPWSMMDMPQREGLRNMGFVASRMVSHRNQRYQWPRYGVTTKRYVSAFNRLQMEGLNRCLNGQLSPFSPPLKTRSMATRRYASVQTLPGNHRPRRKSLDPSIRTLARSNRMMWC